VPLGLAYGVKLVRTGARLALGNTLRDAGLVDGDLVQIVRLSTEHG
jgi:hypothetical protein